MKAIVITGIGGAEVLEIREVPAPEPRGDQVRIRVAACGLNRADLMQCRGMYPAPPGAPADIPGLELAGEVIALGPAASRFAVGDRVMAIVGGGGQAELAVVHERVLMRVPSTLQWVHAGGVPEVFTSKRGHIPLDGGPTDSDSLGCLLTREPVVQQQKHEHLFADTEVGMTAPFLVDDALLFLAQPHAKPGHGVPPCVTSQSG